MQELELDEGGSLARPHRRAASDRLGLSERSAAERRRAGLPARAARRGGGHLVMVELLVARLGQEIRKSILVFCKLNARSGLVHASPGPQDS